VEVGGGEDVKGGAGCEVDAGAVGRRLSLIVTIAAKVRRVYYIRKSNRRHRSETRYKGIVSDLEK
jgi:hypothetical protein